MTSIAFCDCCDKFEVEVSIIISRGYEDKYCKECFLDCFGVTCNYHKKKEYCGLSVLPRWIYEIPCRPYTCGLHLIKEVPPITPELPATPFEGTTLSNTIEFEIPLTRKEKNYNMYSRSHANYDYATYNKLDLKQHS